MVFRHWATGSTQLSSWRERKPEVSLATASIPPRDSSQAAPEAGTQSCPLKTTDFELGEAKVARIYWAAQKERRKVHQESSGACRRASGKGLSCTHRRRNQRAWGDPPESSRLSNSQHSYGSGNSFYFPQLKWKDLRITPVVELNQPQTKSCSGPPKHSSTASPQRIQLIPRTKSNIIT